jgi:hypothetical protein
MPVFFEWTCRFAQVAKRIKEMYSYVCPDIAKEFAKYDQDPDKWIKQYQYQHSVTKKVCPRLPCYCAWSLSPSPL